jgi:protein-tyrosine phosphatase
MVDIHSHIISGIDDGSKSETMSLEMLKISESCGVKAIVATPHFMKGRFNCEYADVKVEVNKLKALAKENNIEIDIYTGQEVYYSRNLASYYTDHLIGTINDTKYMLIELPMLDFNLDEVIDSIYELQIRDITPIIAHAERYKPFIKKSSLINRLIDEGYLFQLNTGSLTGQFGKDVKKTAELYLQNGIYSFIGSDGHRSKGRNTDISDFKNLIDQETLEEFKENSYKMLQDEEVEFTGIKLKEKKNLFALLGGR